MTMKCTHEPFELCECMLKKPGPKKKAGRPKEERKHLDYIASLGCSVCGSRPVEVHHIREFGEPRSHFKTIPLCYNHHRGIAGIHTLGKKIWRKRYGHESVMLDKIHNSTIEEP